MEEDPTFGSHHSSEIESLRSRIAKLEQEQIKDANELTELRKRLHELEARPPADSL